jgi:hypothetical protein
MPPPAACALPALRLGSLCAFKAWGGAFLAVVVQVGTGSRAEKIKTYNYKDSRMSDHRTKNNYDLNKIMDGGLNECIESIVSLDQQERLMELVAEVSR